MKEKISLILLGVLLLPTVAYASDVFGERITMWLIHNYYEEECYGYRWNYFNVTDEECATWMTCSVNYSIPWSEGRKIPSNCGCGLINYVNRTVMNKTEECIKYHLVRKV